jgi:hypothetical protein
MLHAQKKLAHAKLSVSRVKNIFSTSPSKINIRYIPAFDRTLGGASVGGLFHPDGLRGSTELRRGGVSNLRKPAQGGLTTICTFNYFAGDDPTGAVFLADSW